MRARGSHCSRRELLARTAVAAALGGLDTSMASQGTAGDNPRRDENQKSEGDAKPAATALVYDDLYLEHRPPTGFPERPERLSAIVKGLEREGLWARFARLPYSKDALEWVPSVHSRGHVERVRAACREGASYVDTREAPVSARSFDAAVAAVGGAMAAVDAVAAGRARNAFCAVRPPGHHALRNEAMGFCLFNNIAIAARYAQKKHALAKVLIVDWDVHHGNGTQAAFYDDPTVLYFSIHQHPLFPGTGAESERGVGPGENFTINAPVPAGSGNAVFLDALERKLLPAAREFRPDLVLISAGFDAHENDPLAGTRVTTEGFAALTLTVKELAQNSCAGRLVSLLEGGYDLEALAASVAAHARVLMD